MLKPLASGLSGKISLRLFAATMIGLLVAATAHARGKGPVGVWPASERFALVADTSLPGLVLVDLNTGVAVERLKMDDARPVGIASCPKCNFALISGGKSDTGIKSNVWRLHFKGTVSDLLGRDGKLGLNDARLELLDASPPEGKLNDGRMCLVSDDGKTGFIASSADKALVRVDFADTPVSKSLLRHKKAKPFGLNWDRDGNLLVTMHKKEIWRMTADGEVLAVYDVKTAGCPGAVEFKPNLRAAADDPVNSNSVLVLASNPRSYDAVVWRLTVDARGKQTCANAAGRIGFDSGWIDASGEAIEFSRPHYFAPRPGSNPPQLVVTDIDNRALRLLDLATYATTTVMYNRDQIVAALPPDRRLSRASCDKLDWPLSTAVAATTGASICVRPAAADAQDLTLAQAAAHCAAAGARLCEPAELLAAGSAQDARAWTAAECASCWQRTEGESCVIAQQDHRTPDIVHSHKDFSHSWRSGHALVVGTAAAATTLCRPVDDTLKAAAPCCADAKSLAGDDGA